MIKYSMMKMRFTFAVVLLFVCSSWAELNHDGDNEENKVELMKLSTTEELIELICSCKGNEMSETPKPRDCFDILECGETKSGPYTIYPSYDGIPGEPLRVWCDLETDSGGWTVFQRRQDGSLDFNRGWDDYKYGFGYIGAEFWLGNENVHVITNQRDYELRVEIEKFDGKPQSHMYDHFRLTSDSTQYTLITGTYTGTEDVCVHPLGLENGYIKDSQITASSEHVSAAYKAPKARLNSRSGSWYAGTHNTGQWIQVAFDVPKLVTGVILQGRYNAANWVKSYKVQYSNDNATWHYVMDANKPIHMVFDGNTDQHTPVTSFFARPIKTSYIRIRPLTYTHVTLRFELLGCDGDFLAYHNNQAFSTRDADNDAVEDRTCASEGAWWYGTCEESDLNGPYLPGAGSTTRGIIWEDFDGQVHSIKRTEMKIRPVRHQRYEY